MEKQNYNSGFQKEPLKKVQIISQAYYARKDVQQAIYDFCKNRETIPRYLEGFGKRPDVLDYSSDVLNSAKQGATSFHCSEELWSNPLDVHTDMTQEQLNELKIGWDFLIDIDSKYFDYSKIAAKLLIKALEYHGIKNIGVKFSGSKGLHILIPWKAFPQELNNEKTKDKFPEWPRIIAGYLQEIIKPSLDKEILRLLTPEEKKKRYKESYEHLCPKCGNPTVIQKISKYFCDNCKTEMQSTTAVKKTLRCPSCNSDMQKISESEIYYCPECKESSIKLQAQISKRGNRDLEKEKKEIEFEKKFKTSIYIDSADIVLVSPRHLFRAPYSLHEKTALASVVIDKSEVDNFQPRDADPLKVKIKSFEPESEPGEARELLIQALDWAKKQPEKQKKFTGKSIDVKNLTISEHMFPDCIKKILSGIKQDGRKRALFILLAFFSSLEFPQEYIEEKIEKWNKKNYKLLQTGYIKSQMSWFAKNKILPPNCTSHYYKDLGIQCSCSNIKNPINYTIRKALISKKQRKK